MDHLEILARALHDLKGVRKEMTKLKKSMDKIMNGTDYMLEEEAPCKQTRRKRRPRPRRNPNTLHDLLDNAGVSTHYKIVNDRTMFLRRDAVTIFLRPEGIEDLYWEPPTNPNSQKMTRELEITGARDNLVSIDKVLWRDDMQEDYAEWHGMAMKLRKLDDKYLELATMIRVVGKRCKTPVYFDGAYPSYMKVNGVKRTVNKFVLDQLAEDILLGDDDE